MNWMKAPASDIIKRIWEGDDFDHMTEMLEHRLRLERELGVLEGIQRVAKYIGAKHES